MTEDGFLQFQTERFRYSFKVRRYTDNNFWIAMDPVDGHLKPLTQGFLGFDLAEDMTLERAREIANFMNDTLKKVTYTGVKSGR